MYTQVMRVEFRHDSNVLNYNKSVNRSHIHSIKHTDVQLMHTNPITGAIKINEMKHKLQAEIFKSW